MSQLDGEILVRLPALHSVKLAAGNRWQCDCKLRKLVRLLLSQEGKEMEPLLQQWSNGSSSSNYKQQIVGSNNNNHIGKLSTPQVQRTNILQDEPRCAPTTVRTKSDQVEEKASQSLSDVDFVRPSMSRRRRKSYDSDDNNDNDNDNQGEQEEQEGGIAWKNLSK